MFFFLKKEEKWLFYGKNHRLKVVKNNGKKYIIESVEFESGKKSAHHIYLIVNDLLKRKDILQTKYDWYDWSANIIIYQDVSVRLFRVHTKIILLRTTFPMALESFEKISLDTFGQK